MNRHAPTRRIIAVMMLGLTVGVSACGQGTADKAGEEVAAGDYERGPNRGRMLRDGDFALEVTIYEEGPEPLYRLYAYLKDKHVALLAKLEADKAMDKDAEAELSSAVGAFKKTFA